MDEPGGQWFCLVLVLTEFQVKKDAFGRLRYKCRGHLNWTQSWLHSLVFVLSVILRDTGWDTRWCLLN